MKTMFRATVAALALCAITAAAGFQQPVSAEDQKTFRMIVGEPRSLDPNMVTDYSIYVIAQLFEPLARIGPDGKLVMLQAKSIEVGPDGRTWTIELDPNEKWSNGEPVTAADWVYSLRRILDPKLGGEVASFIYDIENASAYNKGEIADIEQVGIKATGDYSFQIVTTKVAPQFRAIIALPYLTPIPKSIVEKAGDKWTEPGNIVSNGPYKLVSWTHDQSLAMERNEYYGGPAPKIGRIEMTVTSGDLCTAQLRAYEAGELDFTTCVPPQDIARVQADSTLSKELSAQPVAATVWVHYDNSHAPWNDQKVRQALALAVDRQAIVAAISNNTAHPTAVIVPENIPGSNPADALQGSVDDAKRLLAEAGFPEGKGFPPFVITASANRGQPVIAQLLQQSWSTNLGIQSTINVLEENAYRAWVKARKNEAYDLMLNQWYSDYADPANWFGDLILQDYRNMHFVNQEFTDLVTKGSAEPDIAKRIKIFQEANKILEFEQPATALYNPTDLWMIKPNVHGLNHEGVLDMYHIGEATIE